MIDTIKQKKTTVSLEDGRQIIVHRMKWKSARDFLKELGKAVTELLKGSDRTPELSASGMASWMDRLPGLITSSDSLIALLLTSSTSLKAQELDELDALEASALVQAAFEVNFDRELKNCWGAVLNAIAGLIGSDKTTPTVASTSSSSGQDSAPNT